MANAQEVASTAKTGPARHSTNTWASRPECRSLASMDFGEPCRSTAAVLVPHMITMRPSDGRPGKIARRWSSQTIWGLRWTIDSMQCVEQLVHARRSAQTRCVMRLSRPRQFAWLTRKMWLWYLRRGQQDTALIHGPQDTCTKTWPQWTSETNVGQQPPEWCHTSSYGAPITMGPSDGQSATLFKSGPRGPPVASDAPSPIHKTVHMHKTIRTAATVDACGLAMICNAPHMHKQLAWINAQCSKHA